MSSLSLPVPVVLFLRRLFNVVSSITISNQYYLLQKTDLDAGREPRAGGEAIKRTGRSPVRSEVLAAQAMRFVDGRDASEVANTTSYIRWADLKPWPWNTDSSYFSSSRHAHSSSNGGMNEKDPFESQNDQNLDEKSTPSSPAPPMNSDPRPSRTSSDEKLSPIHTLMLNPTLFNPVRAPRNPIVLCHGLYGYDVRGPASFPKLQLRYWNSVLKVLKNKLGAEVIVTAVPGTGSIESRAERMDEFLREKARGRDVNFLAHSMGGLDCRQLITHVKPKEYNPLSLTTVCTPHRGSPFMDWCTSNIGIGKLKQQAKEASAKATEITGSPFSLANLPSSLTTLLLSAFDSPAYANLSTHYLENVFNPATPDDPRVKYYSVAARTESMKIIHPLFLPKTVLDSAETRERNTHPRPDEEEWGNDGLVSVRSARWGEFLGTVEGCDHWDVRGARSIGSDTEWSIDLALPSLLKNSLSEPLSHVNLNLNWKDWGRYVGIWQEQEEQREKRERERVGSAGEHSARIAAQASKYESEDAMLKSSTDKLSAVFDWVAEQVPSPSRKTPSPPSTAPSDASTSRTAFASPAARKADSERVDAQKASEAGDARLKFDLEKFYVALSRKLYDDGL